VDRAARKLWGLPVAVSSALSDGTGYLADFTGSTRLWQREAVIVDWSEAVYDTVATATDFQRNLVRFRAEGRFGFAVTRPLGVVEMDTAA
jgi:HK97 family phage major capsid protein